MVSKEPNVDDGPWGLACAVTGLFAVAILVIGSWTLSSHFEAEAYNRLTGNDVSTWDAMFLELRVMDWPKADR